MRPEKDLYYLNIALEVSKRSTCLRRQYGAVIVKNDEIISTGYNGACRGVENCTDLGYCEREEKKIPAGERYELCRAVHAEQNAIISASRRDMIGAAIYIAGTDLTKGKRANPMPCKLCQRFIRNAGIERVVGLTDDGIPTVLTFEPDKTEHKVHNEHDDVDKSMANYYNDKQKKLKRVLAEKHQLKSVEPSSGPENLESDIRADINHKLMTYVTEKIAETLTSEFFQNVLLKTYHHEYSTYPATNVTKGIVRALNENYDMLFITGPRQSLKTTTVLSWLGWKQVKYSMKDAVIMCNNNGIVQNDNKNSVRPYLEKIYGYGIDMSPYEKAYEEIKKKQDKSMPNLPGRQEYYNNHIIHAKNITEMIQALENLMDKDFDVEYYNIHFTKDSIIYLYIDEFEYTAMNLPDDLIKIRNLIDVGLRSASLPRVKLITTSTISDAFNNDCFTEFLEGTTKNNPGITVKQLTFSIFDTLKQTMCINKDAIRREYLCERKKKEEK